MHWIFFKIAGSVVQGLLSALDKEHNPTMYFVSLDLGV